MLEDVIHPQDQQLSIGEEITSPQMLEFCESELFPEILQNSEVASTSNCCYEDHNTYQTQLSNITTEINNFNTNINNKIKAPPISATGPSTPPATTARDHNLSDIFDATEDHIENNISASIDFCPSPSFSAPNHHQYIYNNNNNNNHHEPFNISSLNNHLSYPLHQYGHERWSAVAPPPPPLVPLLAPPPLPISYKDECQLSSYTSRSRSLQHGVQDPMIAPFLPPFPAETSAIFAGGGLMQLGADLSHQELDFQGDNGALFLSHDTMPRVFNCSSELQGLNSESQHLVHGGVSTTTNVVGTTLASDISSLEDPTYKVGKLSVEERKRKIHRYMKKRNERNFSKKIKYACRKTLADSRPRVRGRFAKNDELGEISGRNFGSNHEDNETDEDVSLFSDSAPHHHQRKVVVKEEDEMDSSEILAHISGVNSFKCNYPIQSWI